MIKLPELILFCGDWEKYEEHLYKIFKKDFIDSRPYFKKLLPVAIKKEPKEKNKEATFWHITTFGKDEKTRLQDLRKCEKIGWIRPIIEGFPDCEIKYWVVKRKICLCYGDWDYLVVLLDLKKYVFLITAYPIERQQTKDQLKSQYDYYLRYKKTNTAF